MEDNLGGLDGLQSGATTQTQYVEGPCDYADGIRFKVLCEAFERSQKSTLKQKQRLAMFFRRGLVDVSKKQTMYPIIRLIIPVVDRVRNRYGIRESKLKGLLREVIGVRRDSPAGKQIEQFKDSRIVGTAAGNLPLVVQGILDERGYSAKSSVGKKLTIQDVNIALDELSVATENKTRQQILTRLLTNMDSIEFKWILNIIMVDKMHINIKHESVLRYLHEDALDQYNAHINLRQTCAECKDPEIRVRAQVNLFTPFKPMLGFKPTDNTRCIDGFKDEAFAVEPKLDGERVMVHWFRRTPAKTKIYSRKGIDLGTKYDYKHALQDQLEHALLAEECIVDGELVLYDSETGEYAPFGQNRTEAQEAAEAYRAQEEHRGTRWLCLVTFDVVYVRSPLVPADRQGSLTGLSYLERRSILQKVVRTTSNKVEIIQNTIIDSTDKRERFDSMFKLLEEVILERGEGLMLKRLTSTYDLDKRKRDSWVKVKPEYFVQLSDDLDVIVLAGYLPDGQRRSGGASTFMLGVAKDPQDGGQPTEFYTFGKVGTGYSLNELKRLREVLQEGQHEWTDTPEHLMGWKPAKRDDRPDFWYEPSKSVVFSVSGAEIVRSENWSSQFVIRFPRVRRIRWAEDKPWYDAMRYSELSHMYEQTRGALSRALQDPSRGNGTRKTSRKPNQTKRAQTAIGTVPSQFTAVARAIRENANSESKLFSKLKIHVIPFDVKPPLEFRHVNGEVKSVQSQTDLAVLLQNNGAVYIATPPRKGDLDFVLVHASVNPRRVQNILRLDTMDLVFVDWALACLSRGTLHKPKAKDFFYMCSATRMKYGDFDSFGDHNVEATTGQALQAILSRVEVRTPKRQKVRHDSLATKGNRQDIWDKVAHRALELLLHDEDDPLYTHSTPLRGCVLYFDKFDIVRVRIKEPEKIRDDAKYSRMAALETMSRVYGARVCNELTHEVTHIIMDQHSPVLAEHMAGIRELLRHRRNSRFESYQSLAEPKTMLFSWLEQIIEHAKSPNASALSWEHFPEHKHLPRLEKLPG